MKRDEDGAAVKIARRSKPISNFGNRKRESFVRRNNFQVVPPDAGGAVTFVVCDKSNQKHAFGPSKRAAVALNFPLAQRNKIKVLPLIELWLKTRLLSTEN